MKDEVEKLAIDLERSFEGFRQTNIADGYRSATPTVSKMAADHFIVRFLHWHEQALAKAQVEAVRADKNGHCDSCGATIEYCDKCNDKLENY